MRRGVYLQRSLAPVHPLIVMQLYLQWLFHRPLNYPAPYPARPIFTRVRPPTASEVEAGLAAHDSLVPERSFYKNTYSMVRPLSS